VLTQAYTHTRTHGRALTHALAPTHKYIHTNTYIDTSTEIYTEINPLLATGREVCLKRDLETCRSNGGRETCIAVFEVVTIGHSVH